MSVAFGGRRYNFDWRSFITPGVKLIVLVCTGVFVVQTLVAFGGCRLPTFIYQVFALIPRAVTHAYGFGSLLLIFFCTADICHLLINMLMFWMFGRDLEAIWGKRRFLNFFSLWRRRGADRVGCEADPAFLGHVPSVIPTIGASGAIFGILMANASFFPIARSG